MGFLQDLFLTAPCSPSDKPEVEELLNELFQIGKVDDFLSERPGLPFNSQCRHIRARKIGTRFNEIGGLQLMEYALKKIQKKLGKNMADHLEYAWSGIGQWLS